MSVVVPVVLRPDYRIGFEAAAGVTFVHCEVARWSHHVARSLRTDFEALAALHGAPLYAIGRPGDAKHRRFVTLFGFWPAGTVLDHTGTVCPIYERTTDGQHVRWWHHDHY